MAGDVDVVRTVAAAPLRTVRLRDLRGFGQNAWRTVDRLVEQGALTRLLHGVYTAPPDGRDGRTWKPPLEAAALAVATARFGARRVALTGVSAARHLAAIPRAIGIATVAVPRAGYAPVELDGGGAVRFVPRDVDRLEVVLERTALGEGLVTTPEQTLFDLLARPLPVELANDIPDGIRNLAARADAGEFERIATRARGNAAVREMAARLNSAATEVDT